MEETDKLDELVKKKLGIQYDERNDREEVQNVYESKTILTIEDRLNEEVRLIKSKIKDGMSLESISVFLVSNSITYTFGRLIIDPNADFKMTKVSMVRLRDNGYTYTQIAKLFGKSSAWPTKFLSEDREASIEIKTKLKSHQAEAEKAIVDRINKLREEGKTLMQIAGILNRPYSYVYNRYNSSYRPKKAQFE